MTRGQEDFAHAKWLASAEELVAGDYFGTSAILGSGELGHPISFASHIVRISYRPRLISFHLGQA